MSDKSKFMITSTPHIRSNDTIKSVMQDVLIAMAPAAVVAVFYFGAQGFLVMALSVAAAVAAEFVYQKLTDKPVTIGDFSAVVTGLLLAFNLPASVPLWLPIVGSIFAIIIVKQLFGGVGQNFLNPALAARAFLLASYPTEMTNWSIRPLNDAISSATPLALLKQGVAPNAQDYINALLGIRGGCIGEVCIVALLIGGIYLIARKVITWRIPVIYIGTVFLFSFILGRNGAFDGYPVYELIVGGLVLGAFFMATDYTTSPMTMWGQVIFAVGCGVMTVVIRRFSGGYPEGVSYSILFMNLTVPLIDKWVRPRVFGTTRRKKEVAARG